ncbi:MAG: hypothetical protein ABIE74_04920 [Pseudomonadota bacterium]
MKKTMKFFAIASMFLFSASALADAKPVVLLPDFLTVRVPVSGWKVGQNQGDELIFSMNVEKPEKDEFFNPRFLIRRIDARNSVKKDWKLSVEESLGRRYEKVYPVPANDKEKHYLSYSFSDHFLPIEGFAEAQVRQGFVYVLECQRQRIEQKKRVPLLKWCSDFFDSVGWPENKEYKQDASDYLARWAAFPFDSSGLEAEFKNLNGKIDADLLDEALIRDYVGLIMTDGLYSAKPKAASLVLGDLDVVTEKLKPEGNSILLVLINIHRAYLNNDLAQVEKLMEGLIKSNANVPYWLFSRWIMDKNTETALSFADRGMKAYPSFLSKYTKANLLNRSGDYQGSSELLAGEKNANPMVLALQASNAVELGHEKESLEYFKRAEKINPDDVNLLFTKARFYSKSKVDDAYVKADQVYQKLSDIPNLSRDNKIRLYLEWAEHVFDVDKKVDLYNKAIELKKNLPQVYYALGKMYLVEKQDASSAVRNFKEYLKYASKGDTKAEELKKLVAKLESGM